jgi:hemolysin III
MTTSDPSQAAVTSGQLADHPLQGAAALLKPRLRGWLHAYAAVISVMTGATLVSVASLVRGASVGWATLLYSVTVTALFTTSASYHRIHWGPRGRSVMKRLDHSMIFVFIAGTYTALAVVAMPRDEAETVLLIVWAGAIGGVALKVIWPGSPSWIGVPCYIALGWVAVFVFPQLLEHGGVAALALLVVGGVLYTVGGVVYAIHWPDPAPQTFGYHEVFHLCTILAAACHYLAIWFALF